MHKLWDFHGGVHLPPNKRQSTAAPIRSIPLPERLLVPLQQHTGSPARCLVEAGSCVAKGEAIAAANEGLSVTVHAPTSGRVLAIEPHPIAHPSGLSDWCIVIEPDGEDRWTRLDPCPDYYHTAPEELLDRISAAGIAGLGGAGFPTKMKLHSAVAARVHTLILNGAECEPYITADQMLMQERAAEVIGGAEIIAHLLAPVRCLIAVEDDKPLAIQALRDAATSAGFTPEIIAIPARYPSGGEKQLIEILTGQQVPHGAIPPEISIVCQNVGTAAAVYRAVVHGEPLLSRITTVAGQTLQNPGNFEVLTGTPLEDLLRAAGIRSEAVHKLLVGGPMMGHPVDNLQIPITKTTNCIIAATAAELPDPPPAQACIRCGLCEQACPMELLPQQLYWFARSGEHDKAEAFDLFDCIECGACSYVCPSSIPLVDYYRGAKAEIRQQQAERVMADRARERFEARQRRLEQEQADKEARRQARKAAASAAPAPAAPVGTAPAPQKSRSAAVQAALERAQAKQRGQGTDLSVLEKNVAQIRDKLEKMQADLDEASDPKRAEKMQQAIASNRARLRAAEKALAAASPQSEAEAVSARGAGDNQQ